MASVPRSKIEIAFDVFRLWLGDPKTRIPTLLILAGLPLVASPWWQPVVNGFVVKWLEVNPQLLNDSEFWLATSGWVLIILGIILYIRASHTLATSLTTTSSTSDITLDSTVPEGIQRNAITAFGQLGTACIDLPIAQMEGLVQEKRAVTRTRVRLIESLASSVQSNFVISPEYAKAVGNKFAERIVREQINLDRVTAVAAEEINKTAQQTKSQQAETAEIQPIDPDWLNQFEAEARRVSTDAMSLLFGKILAGEIQRPSSFSMRTISSLRGLDLKTATLFRKFCSCCISIAIPVLGVPQLLDARVVSLGGSAGSNSLLPHGFSFDQLNILNEYGLIIADYNSYGNYGVTVVKNGSVILPMQFQSHQWCLIPDEPDAVNSPESLKELRIHGVALSRVGRELLPIVDIDPDAPYTKALGVDGRVIGAQIKVRMSIWSHFWSRSSR